MRIYFFSPQLTGHGGMETILLTMTKSLQQNSHEVTIVLMDPSSNSSWEEGLNIINLNQICLDDLTLDNQYFFNRLLSYGEYL